MKEILQLLQTRNSAPRLTGPGPDPEALQQMFASALRAPDHAWLKPWRFLVIEGDARAELGRVFEGALLKSQPDADQAARDKARKAPMRAPLMVVVVCRFSEHPKVPRDEQLLSAGCAAHSLLLAAEAQGYAGIWRTGNYALDSHVHEALGVAENEEVVGFLYFGTRDGQAKALPQREVDEYVSYWRS